MSVVHDDQLFAELARLRTTLPADSTFLTGLEAVLDLRYAPFALGFVAQTFVTTDQLAIGAGPSNMANFDLGVTLVANRRYKFTSSLVLGGVTAGSAWIVDLLDGATNLGRMAIMDNAPGGDRKVGVLVTGSALSAGARTLHLSISRVAGAGTIDSYANPQKAFLLVEDIGSF